MKQVLLRETTIPQLEKGMKTVIARLEEQAAQIQKVSDQLATGRVRPTGGLEASKFAKGRIRSGGPASQVVNNP